MPIISHHRRWHCRSRPSLRCRRRVEKPRGRRMSSTYAAAAAAAAAAEAAAIRVSTTVYSPRSNLSGADVCHQTQLGPCLRDRGGAVRQAVGGLDVFFVETAYASCRISSTRGRQPAAGRSARSGGLFTLSVYFDHWWSKVGVVLKLPPETEPFQRYNPFEA